MKQTQRSEIDRPSEVIEVPIAVARIEACSGLRQDVRPRIAHAIDAMSESHQTLAPIQLGADDEFCALGSAGLEHHIERWTWRAAMERALERPDGTGDR